MENWLLVTVLSLDTLFVCLTYGMKKIKIPFLSALTIAGIGTGCFTTSVLLGNLISSLLISCHAEELLKKIGFTVLLIMGVVNLLQSLLKRMFRQSKSFHFNISELNFVLNICIDETKADLDCSQNLSVREAILLASALSADSLLGGFSVQGNPATLLCLSVYSLIMGLMAIYLGMLLGKRMSQCGFNLSWLSGVILILIAFWKRR